MMIREMKDAGGYTYGTNIYLDTSDLEALLTEMRKTEPDLPASLTGAEETYVFDSIRDLLEEEVKEYIRQATQDPEFFKRYMREGE